MPLDAECRVCPAKSKIKVVSKGSGDKAFNQVLRCAMVQGIYQFIMFLLIDINPQNGGHLRMTISAANN